jgi:hypothetical protein
METPRLNHSNTHSLQAHTRHVLPRAATRSAGKGLEARVHSCLQNPPRTVCLESGGDVAASTSFCSQGCLCIYYMLCRSCLAPKLIPISLDLKTTYWSEGLQRRASDSRLSCASVPAAAYATSACILSRLGHSSRCMTQPLPRPSEGTLGCHVPRFPLVPTLRLLTFCHVSGTAAAA